MGDQPQRIGFRRPVLLVGDPAVGRRPQMVDHHVFVNPLPFVVQLAMDHRVARSCVEIKIESLVSLASTRSMRVLRGAVGVHSLDRGQRADQVDRGDAVGDAVGQQIARPGFVVPLARLVELIRQEDSSCAVGISVEPDEVDRLVFRMLVPNAVLPDRKTQAPADPGAVRAHHPRLVEELVGNIEMRQMRRATAVMAVIAAEDEVRAVESVRGPAISSTICPISTSARAMVRRVVPNCPRL